MSDAEKCQKCDKKYVTTHGVVCANCGQQRTSSGESDKCRITELERELHAAREENAELKSNIVNKIKQPGEWMNSLSAQMDMDWGRLHTELAERDEEIAGLRSLLHEPDHPYGWLDAEINAALERRKNP